MKTIQFAYVSFAMMLTVQCSSKASEFPSLWRRLAESDIIGIGTYGGYETGSYRINNITYWLGDPGTNSVSVMLESRNSHFCALSPDTINDTVIFFGTRLGWQQSPTNFVFRATPFSSWEWREKLIQAGSAEQVPSPPFQFPGDWINVTTNSPNTVNFISNVVQSLCISPDLIQYSQSLIPPLNIGWESELFMFKADAHMELLKLEWGESEDFLVHILNSSLYPERIRGSALFQLKKRFDWPATNTVPVP